MRLRVRRSEGGNTEGRVGRGTGIRRKTADHRAVTEGNPPVNDRSRYQSRPGLVTARKDGHLKPSDEWRRLELIFRINAIVLNKGERKEVFFLAESDHVDMADLHQSIVNDGCLLITRYETRGPNEREREMLGKRRARFVTDCYEMILHRDAFSSITEPNEDLIDTDGEPLLLVHQDAPELDMGGGR